MGLFPGETNFNNVTGGLTVTGGTTTDTLTVNSTSTFKNGVTITAGGLNVTGGLSADYIDVSTTLTVTGQATLNGGLQVSGSASWTGNGSSGGTDFELGLNDTSRGTPGSSGHYRALVKQTNNLLVINYGGDFTGGVEIQGGSVKVDGTLDVTGAVTFSNGLTVTNSITTHGGISATGTNAGFEIGASGTSNTPYIDFHSGATGTDYDTRIIASGGNGVTGGGTLQIIASNLETGQISVSGKIISSVTGESIRIIGGGTPYINSYIAFYESDNSTRGGWMGYGSSSNNILTLYNDVGPVATKNNTLDDGSGNMTIAGALIATSAAESHFANNGAYVDPQSGASRAIKASGGIATDYLYSSGNVAIAGGFYVNGALHVQLLYESSIPTNGAGGYKWTYSPSVPTASANYQPAITLNIVPGTQYFSSCGNFSRTAGSYYQSSSGTLGGWLYLFQQ